MSNFFVLVLIFWVALNRVPNDIAISKEKSAVKTFSSITNNLVNSCYQAILVVLLRIG